MKIETKKTIKISKSELAAKLMVAHHGSTEWDIFINDSGDISELHNTHDNRGWYLLVDLYSTDSYEGVEDYTAEDWLFVIGEGERSGDYQLSEEFDENGNNITPIVSLVD